MGLSHKQTWGVESKQKPRKTKEISPAYKLRICLRKSHLLRSMQAKTLSGYQKGHTDKTKTNLESTQKPRKQGGKVGETLSSKDHIVSIRLNP